METMSPSTLSSHHEDASNYDEFSMQESLLFSDSLKGLKNLRSQLYSAAEYFELSYCSNSPRPSMMNSLKDYAVEALVNTVDHLGSVSYKVNDLLDEKVDEVSRTEIRVSCIEQRIRTCQDFIDQEGLSQQSLIIQAPKYHKHYIVQDITMLESGRHSNVDGKLEELRPVISPATNRPSSFRKMPPPSPLPSSIQRSHSISPSSKVRSPSPSPRTRNSNFKTNGSDRRAGSPISTSNPLTRAASFSSRQAVLDSSTRRYSTGTQDSAPIHFHAERNNKKETDKNSNKSRGFLKALLTRRRSRNDESLYSYLDEY
ncbi:probable protein ABIL3 [Typha latifolia]|uniref:probable protein ABIL3 n=1 Tax=Typha latifolia TaxID=4733 RepID=UPI003C2EE917